MSDIREASLEHEPVRLPGGFALQAGPFAILAIGALWLHRHFDELPARLPVHWNWRGVADGFARRTPLAAAMPLILGFAIASMTLAMQFGLRRSSPRGAMRGPSLRVLLGAEYLIALLCCGILAASATSGRLLWPVLVLAFAAILVMLVATFVALKGIPRPPVRNPAAWRGGLFYVDREDPALFVPKKYGGGYTFNYGRPLAWVILFAFLIVPLAIAIFAAVNAR